jgi:ketosteroid isomerase-like protein
MSATDVVKGFYGGFATGDIKAVLALLDPDVEWIEAAGFPYAGTYHGPMAVLARVFTRLGSEWDGFQAEPESILGGGDQVAALGWYSGTYKETGKAFQARFVHWFTVQGETITKFEQIVDSSVVNACLIPL